MAISSNSSNRHGRLGMPRGGLTLDFFVEISGNCLGLKMQKHMKFGLYLGKVISIFSADVLETLMFKSNPSSQQWGQRPKIN